MSNDPVYSILRASLEEHVPVTVYVKGNALEGVVRSLDEAAIELELDGRRSAVRWASIDAAAMQPHESPDEDDDEKKADRKDRRRHHKKHGHHHDRN